MKKVILWIFIIIFAIGIIELIVNPSEFLNANPNTENVNSNTINENATDSYNNISNIANETESSKDTETDLEDKLKKALVKFTFESFQNENGIVTLTATKTGNAQYSISEDVEYEYIRTLAPIVYSDESINNFIFKVTITDNTNKDFNYTYGCSLNREKYISKNWNNVLDKEIYKIFITDGEIYSE